MPPPKSAAPAPVPEPLYPNIEGFIEYAGAPDIEQLFGDVKAALDSLKGPKAEQAKKARVALERTQELLEYLLSVRVGLEQPKQKPRR